MLRITIYDDGKVCRLELAGRLEGPWVAETENAWRFSLGPDRKIEVDLRQLTGIDKAGHDLLAAIHLAGACLIVEGVWLTALIGDLTSQPSWRRLHAQAVAEQNDLPAGQHPGNRRAANEDQVRSETKASGMGIRCSARGHSGRRSLSFRGEAFHADAIVARG